MLKPSPVMSDLHQISAKIAATTKSMKDHTVANDAAARAESDQSAKDDSAATASPASSPSEAASVSPSPGPTSSDQALSNEKDKRLSEALRRRYEDYGMTRRDLSIRVTKAVAILERRASEIETERNGIRLALNRLTEFQSELAQESPLRPSDAEDQTRLSAECRKLEDMRLETIRVTAALPRTDRNAQPSADGRKIEPVRPEDIHFFRVLGWGFAFHLPLVLGILLSTILLGVLIIGAFSGTLRW